MVQHPPQQVLHVHRDVVPDLEVVPRFELLHDLVLVGPKVRQGPMDHRVEAYPESPHVALVGVGRHALFASTDDLRRAVCRGCPPPLPSVHVAGRVHVADLHLSLAEQHVLQREVPVQKQVLVKVLHAQQHLREVELGPPQAQGRAFLGVSALRHDIPALGVLHDSESELALGVFDHVGGPDHVGVL